MPYQPIDMAHAFIQAGELPDALEALNAHLNEHADDIDALRLRAEVYAHLPGDTHRQAALRDLDALPQQSPADYMLRAEVLMQSGDPSAAHKALRAGCAAYPDDERLAEALVTRLVQAGEIAHAQEIVAAMNPDGTGWRWSSWAGDMARTAGDLKNALAHYSAALHTLEARYTFTPSQAAAILRQDDTLSEAAALTVMAAYGRLRVSRAAVYRLLNEYTAADADLQVAVQLLPDDPAIPFNRGVLAYLRGEHEGAIALCALALNMASAAMKAHLLAELRLTPALYGLLEAIAPE